MVNIDFINSNVKSPCNKTKFETSSYQNSVNILYNTDMDNISNILPFHKCKIQFPRSNRKLLSSAESKITKFKTYIHIETLCLLTIDDKMIGTGSWHLAIMQTKHKRNCHCERPVHTEDRKLESYADKRQDVDAQK